MVEMNVQAAEAPPSGREAIPLVPSGPCWICGGREFDRVWRDPLDLTYHPRFGRYAHADHPDTWLVRCRTCGFGQPEAMPGIDDYFDLLYADQPWLTEEVMAEDFDGGRKDAIFRQVLSGLARYQRNGAPRSVLDVGSYIGRFLHLAHQAAWQAEGAELNTRAADFASRRTGLPIHLTRAQDLIAQGRTFGAVTMIDVLEHIPYPLPLVTQLRQLLVPGGVMAIKLPHGPIQRFKEGARALLYRTPKSRDDHRVSVMARFVHVNHFTVGSLRRLLESAGFTGVRVLTAAPEYLPPSPARTRSQASSAWIRQATYTLARVVPGSVYTPLAPQLLAFGVHPGA
jgi:SAM-dependent methyltransferase